MKNVTDNSTVKTKKKREHFTLVKQLRSNKKAFAVYLTLSTITAIFAIRSIVNAQWESAFVCFLALLLYLIPPFLERTAKIELPTVLEILAFVFVFCSQILGELGNFYIRFPLWDTMLHTVCGFMFAAFGFCLMDILTKQRVNKFEMSPVFLAFIAFCFSMTIGVFWEFIEFGIDLIFHTDMQKDFYLDNIFSVALDPDASNKVVAVNGITDVLITLEDGSTVPLSGYLDIGLIDTMKDLLVNFIGAVIFSIIGFFYVKHRGKGKFARHFIPEFNGDQGKDDNSEPEENLTGSTEAQ